MGDGTQPEIVKKTISNCIPPPCYLGDAEQLLSRRLFAAEAGDGIAQGRLDGLRADCHHSDEDGQ
jgi:hypothetical protein